MARDLVSYAIRKRASKFDGLAKAVKSLYEKRADQVPFHGWHHVEFVRMKAAQFARERHADARSWKLQHLFTASTTRFRRTLSRRRVRY
jgi:hypothetical protein